MLPDHLWPLVLVMLVARTRDKEGRSRVTRALQNVAVAVLRGCVYSVCGECAR